MQKKENKSQAQKRSKRRRRKNNFLVERGKDKNTCIRKSIRVILEVYMLKYIRFL